MTALSDHKSSRFVKLLYIGDSGTGKTGSLCSLVEAGYKLRILDMDNGVTVLRKHINKNCPDKLDMVDVETRRDSYVPSIGGPVVKGVAKAYVEATKLMTEWSDGSIPSEWGQEYVFVLDSLSAMSRASFELARSLNPTSKDPRQWYNQAQQSVETVLAMLTSESFEANVIVISHVQYTEDRQGNEKGYVNSIGKALGPRIPSYFNSLILAEMAGFGKTRKYTIRTVPTNLITLKTPAPFEIDETLPLESGLATLFEKLKEI